MRLLLLNPFQVTTKGYDYKAVLNKGQYAEEPLGLGYIASYCKAYMDLDVRILDANIFAIDRITGDPAAKQEAIAEEVLNMICDYRPDVVGVSCLFHILAKNTHLFIAKIKDRMPDVKVVMGGSYPTASPEHTLSDKNIDFAVIGEGERPMLQIMKYYRGLVGLESLDSVGYVKDNAIVVKPTATVIKEIDEFGLPQRNEIYFEKYSRLGRHFFDKTRENENELIASMTASRGCPFNCTFCISVKMWHRKLRFRKIENVLHEIGVLKKRYGIKYLVFNDDNMTVNRDFTIRLCKGIIERGFDIKWSISGGIYVPSLDEEMVELMIKSGFNIFNLAIESGSQEILNSIRKKVSLDEVKEKVNLLRKFDVYIGGYFMLGFPHETQEQFRSTIDFSSALDLDWRIYQCVQAYPGTDLYNECCKEGLIDKDFSEDFEILERRSYVIKPVYLSQEYVLHESYLANLKYNFLNNRNLAGKKSSLKRAIMDFEWVLNMIPDHIVAAHSLSMAYEKIGDTKRANFFKRRSLDLAKDEDRRKRYCLDDLGLGTEKEE